jgi:hypothetical protein
MEWKQVKAQRIEAEQKKLRDMELDGERPAQIYTL